MKSLETRIKALERELAASGGRRVFLRQSTDSAERRTELDGQIADAEASGIECITITLNWINQNGSICTDDSEPDTYTDTEPE